MVWPFIFYFPMHRRHVALKRPRGKKEEDKDHNSRYYAMNDHPNYHDFVPEYVDQAGREYQVASDVNVRLSPTPVRANSHKMRLWVRLPPGTDWYKKARTGLVLRSLNNENETHAITVRESFIFGPGHRTGHVHISASEWK